MALFELGIFAAVALAVLGVAWMLTPRRDAVKDRLAALHTDDVPFASATPEPVRRRGFLASFGRRRAKPASPGGAPVPADLRSAEAFDPSIRGYLVAKAVLMIALPALTALAFRFANLLHTPWALMAILSAAPVGLFAPNVFQALREAARKDRLRRALPDVLDLLVICVEAGMSLNTAFKRVAERMRSAAPELADEFLQLHREIQAGRSREDALRSLGERVKVDELRALAAMMIQTDRMGTSIAKALRVHADSIRTKFHHEAEARAARATVKLAFPLVLCIFPALLVVIVGPAAVKIVDALGKTQ